MNQENVDQAHQYKRERRSSILGSIFKTTSTLSGGDADRGSPDTMPQPPPRPVIPKVFNFIKYARGKQRILETVDQNATDITPDIEELEDIDDEELEDKVVPVPYADEEETLYLLSSSTSTSHAQSNAIVDSELRKDSRLILEMKSGPYYEVWDPRVRYCSFSPSLSSCFYFLTCFIQRSVFNNGARNVSAAFTVKNNSSIGSSNLFIR